MMKRILLSLMLLPASLVAQSIAPMLTASCGNVFSGPAVLLEWSAGEAVIASLSAPSILLTQGFHQPSLIVTAVTESQVVTMEVWPNPMTEILHLRSTLSPSEPVRVDLYNALGQCVLHTDWNTSDHQIQLSLAGLSAGTYTLTVSGSPLSKTHSWNILKLAY